MISFFQVLWSISTLIIDLKEHLKARIAPFSKADNYLLLVLPFVAVLSKIRCYTSLSRKTFSLRAFFTNLKLQLWYVALSGN